MVHSSSVLTPRLPRNNPPTRLPQALHKVEIMLTIVSLIPSILFFWIGGFVFDSGRAYWMGRACWSFTVLPWVTHLYITIDVREVCGVVLM